MPVKHSSCQLPHRVDCRSCSCAHVRPCHRVLHHCSNDSGCDGKAPSANREKHTSVQKKNASLLQLGHCSNCEWQQCSCPTSRPTPVGYSIHHTRQHRTKTPRRMTQPVHTAARLSHLAAAVVFCLSRQRVEQMKVLCINTQHAYNATYLEREQDKACECICKQKHQGPAVVCKGVKQILSQAKRACVHMYQSRQPVTAAALVAETTHTSTRRTAHLTNPQPQSSN